MFKYRSIKIRCYPTSSQKDKINLNINLCRQIHNLILTHEYSLYDKYLKTKDKYSSSLEFFRKNKRKKISILKLEDPRYKFADSIALEYEEKNIFMAFKNYFNTSAKCPKFKHWKFAKSYTTRNKNNNLRIQGNYIRLPKIGFIKIKNYHKKYLTMEICIAKVINEKNGKYDIHLTLREKIQNAKPFCFNTSSKVVGLDFKIGNIFMSSDNFVPTYSLPYHNNFERLSKLEKVLKHKNKFSKNYKKIMIKIRNIHKKIVNIRRDLQHKLSSMLCSEYDFAIIESLNLQDISQKLLNGSNTYDTSYGTFTDMLKYKFVNKVISINKWFPSSKLCCYCKHKKHNLTLDDRTYICDNCGLIIDRDLNAAINIKNEGIRILKNQFNTQ